MTRKVIDMKTRKSVPQADGADEPMPTLPKVDDGEHPLDVAFAAMCTTEGATQMAYIITYENEVVGTGWKVAGDYEDVMSLMGGMDVLKARMVKAYVDDDD